MMITRPPTASEPSVGNKTQSPELLEAFASLIDDLESFLSDWVQSVEHAMILSEAAAAPEHALRKRIRAFDVEKRRWESTRRQEAKLARQRCEVLTEAWLQLEAEQQRFLQMKQSCLPSGAADRGEFAADPEPAGGAATLNERAGAAALPATAAILSAATPSAAAAVQQFQRLRREIDLVGPRPANS